MSRRRRGQPLHGLLLLDKPTGMSSNRALQTVRRLFDARKAGHTGSLDPLATGLLPLAFGEATRLTQYLLNADKGYETVMRLGVTTDSLDRDGTVLETRPIQPGIDVATIDAAAAPLRGNIEQIPPMVSALKHKGRRLHELARAGIEVDRPPRAVTVHELKVLSCDGDTARLFIRCSKGTYVRSLVRDLGEALGCGAHVQALRRTFVAPFQHPRMITLDSLEEEAGREGTPDTTHLLPIDAGLDHLPICTLAPAALSRFRQGQAVEPPAELMDGDLLRIRGLGCERLEGLGRLDDAGLVAPQRVIQWS